MQIDDQIIHDRILELLDEAGRPLTARGIGSRLRFENVRLADHQVVEELRKLLKNDDVTLDGAKWSTSISKSLKSRSKKYERQGSPLIFPTLSPETNERFGWQLQEVKSYGAEIIESQEREATDIDLDSKWGAI